MTLDALLREFSDDPGIRLAVTLVLLDFVLGVSAAVKVGTFRLCWLPDFLRSDVLFKLVPYFGVWAAVRIGGDLSVLGIGAIEETVGLAIIGAIGASILNSLRDLGFLKKSTPDEIAGSDAPPPKP